jgi:hypothetical protein
MWWANPVSPASNSLWNARTGSTPGSLKPLQRQQQQASINANAQAVHGQLMNYCTGKWGQYNSTDIFLHCAEAIRQVAPKITASGMASALEAIGLAAFYFALAGEAR